MYAGSVWAIVDTSDYACEYLTSLVERFPEYLLPEPFDDPETIANNVRLAPLRAYQAEYRKTLKLATGKDLALEILSRISKHLRRLI